MLVPNQTTESKASLACLTCRMAPGEGVQAVQRAVWELSKVAGDVVLAVRTVQAILDKHRAVVPGRPQPGGRDGTVAQAGSARAQLRDALAYRCQSGHRAAGGAARAASCSSTDGARPAIVEVDPIDTPQGPPSHGRAGLGVSGATTTLGRGRRGTGGSGTA